MNVKVKLGAYVVLLILAALFAWGFYSNYSLSTRKQAEPPVSDVPPVATNASNQTANAPDSTNNPAASQTTNQEAKASNAPAPPASSSGAAAAAPSPTQGAQSRMIAYLAAFVGAVIGLGLLIAHDVSQIVGNAAVDALLDDRGEGARDPEYEKAEQVWADGKFLEAIQMMRDYLTKHPREQYVALRIAEIYEKDLNNFLAAALEYEEVLKKKLPAERWGWSAIHLCNLYSKLGQQDKTRALLQRIADEYPKTGAAKKARSRLGIAEPEPEEEPASAENAEAEPEPGQAQVIDPPTEQELNPTPTPDPVKPPEPTEQPPKPSLPPGFRPKK